MDYGTTGLTSSTPAAREQSEAPPLPSGPAPDTPPPPSSATAEPVVMATTNSAGYQGQPSSAPSASQLHTSFVAETLALTAPGTELHARLSTLLAAAQVPTFAVAKTPEEMAVMQDVVVQRNIHKVLLRGMSRLEVLSSDDDDSDISPA